MRIIGRILLGLLASVGLVVVVVMGLAIYAVSKLEDERAPMARAPDKIMLTLDLDEELDEQTQRRGLAGLGFRSEPTFQDVVIALRRATDDPRVAGLTATLSTAPLGLAQIQELRDLVAAFEAAGKPTFLYSETMGETVGAMTSYYLASAFDNVWVQPSGTIGIAGIGTEELFFKDFLDRLGLKGAFLQRKEYKSAGEQITNSRMSPANREALEGLLGAWFEQIVAGIAQSRNLTPDAVKSLVDKGPLMAAEARSATLVDQVGYQDEFEAALKERVAGATKVTVARYLSFGRPEGTPAPAKKIALIHAVGQIVRGDEDDGNATLGGAGVRSGVMAKALRDAANDNDVAAILIRVDSPGGSYVASDTIWREIVKAKEKKKPVIVSMGNTAASGGYFIAMPADRIFAQPGTVTGSIGVVLGKLVISGALEKLDINRDRIAFGDSAGIFSATTDFSPQHLTRLNEMLDATYADFTAKAAQGRGKTAAEIESAARGRVWSGTDALRAGLVDELGGFSQAIDYAKTQVGLAPTDSLELVPFPTPQDPWRALFRTLEDPDLPFGIASVLHMLSRLAQVAAPVLRELDAANQPGTQLYMEPVSVK